MKNYRMIMQDMPLEELREYAYNDLPKQEVDAMSRETLINFLEDNDLFAENYEMGSEGSEWMHPDESVDEFFEHEAPDKD